MSVQHIDNGTKSGWQARQFIKSPRYLSAFFSEQCYGKRLAKKLARETDEQLKAEAARMRGGR